MNQNVIKGDTDALVKELRDMYDFSKHSTDDVKLVLEHIGKPGTYQDLKREVVGRLFPRKSPQGKSTADDLENYAEY